MLNQVKKKSKVWKCMEKNYTLDYQLSMLTKVELINIGRNLHIDKISSLNKEALKSRIEELYEEKINYFLENIDAERLNFLLNLYRKGNVYLYDGSIDLHKICYFKDRALTFTANIDGKSCIIIPLELHKIILNKCDETLKVKLRRNKELINLFWGMCFYYGVVTLAAFKTLAKRYINFSLNGLNLKDILEEAACYYEEFNFDGTTGSDITLEDASGILEAQEKRNNLSFYPLKKEELLKAAQRDYIDKTGAYNKLYKFFLKNYDMDKGWIEDIISSLYCNVRCGDKFNDIVLRVLENFNTSSAQEANLISNEVMEFVNNTRQWFIKGYTPLELRNIKEKQKAIVGRNDPCPCGSGRKYKKCCGKLRLVR